MGYYVFAYVIYCTMLPRAILYYLHLYCLFVLQNMTSTQYCLWRRKLRDSYLSYARVLWHCPVGTFFMHNFCARRVYYTLIALASYSFSWASVVCVWDDMVVVDMLARSLSSITKFEDPMSTYWKSLSFRFRIKLSKNEGIYHGRTPLPKPSLGTGPG